jgi:hypothetical protein
MSSAVASTSIGLAAVHEAHPLFVFVPLSPQARTFL